jgi:hypothetical protein
MYNSDINYKNKIKLLIILVIVGLILVVGVFALVNLNFRVVGTTPNSSKVNTASPYFDINFNKPLSSKVSASSPQGAVSSYKVYGKTLVVSLNIPLKISVFYTISLKNIYDTSGKHLNNLNFYFKPAYVADNNLPSNQTQDLLNGQVQYLNSTYGAGLAQQLPFTEPNLQYKITYTSNGSSYVFQITAANIQNQQAALEWIKVMGYNPANLNIQYINQQPN